MINLTVSDLDLKKQTLKIVHGKGDKMRFVPFGAKTRLAIWKWLEDRKTGFLFTNSYGNQLTATSLGRLVRNVGKLAGVEGVRPHRFRHTFAIQFLRNGGHLFALSHIMGHSSIDITKRYVKLAQVDITAAHEKGSPVDHWL